MSEQEPFLGTARRWRPSRFADVVGQEHVTATLRNAIAQHRIAAAYIFAGPRGIGKTTTARVLAKALNCTNLQSGEPCNTCEQCRAINDGSSMDVNEIDGASNNSVDDVRKLRESARYPPVLGTYKLYIIDEVHMLSTSAFNALLKTLEEPPAHLLFVFATTEIQKVPATILSRCQRFDFRRMQVEDIIARLTMIAKEEHVAIDDDALLFIARKADGAMRDALSVFDQVRAVGGTDIRGAQVRETLNIIEQDIFFRASDLIKAHDRTGVFAFVADLVNRGIDLQEFIGGLGEHLRNILYAATTGSASQIETTKHYQETYSADAAQFSPHDLLQLLGIAIETGQSLKYALQPRVHLEFAMLKMASLDSAVDLRALLDTIGTPGPGQSQSVPSGTASTPRPAPSRPAAPPPPAVQASAATIVREPQLSPDADLVSSWNAFVALARERRVKCWSALEHNSSPVELAGSTLRVSCTDVFHLEMCRKNIPELTRILRELRGPQFAIEFVDTLSTATSAPPTAASASSPEARTDDSMIQVLVRELGAKEIL